MLAVRSGLISERVEVPLGPSVDGWLVFFGLVLEQRGMTLADLSERVGITLANLSIPKSNRPERSASSTPDALCRE